MVHVPLGFAVKKDQRTNHHLEAPFVVVSIGDAVQWQQLV